MAVNRKFKDAEGRTWIIRIDYAVIKRVRKADLGIDLATLLADNMKGLGVLFDDVMTFIDTLWVIVGEQHASVTDEEFGVSLRGDALGEARNCFLNAYADFCPSDQREILLTLIAKITESQQEALKQLKAMKPSDMISGESVANSQPSQESQPTSIRLVSGN